MGSKREGRTVLGIGGNDKHLWRAGGGQLEPCLGRDTSLSSVLKKYLSLTL